MRTAAIVAAAVVAVGASAARAQSAHKRTAGVFGGDPAGPGADTAEVDRCERPAGLSRDVIDARVSEHYDRGTVLYAQGDYEGAIEEFVAAYCYGRYPSILVDIGQAYERLVNYEKAVAYLDRYIIEAPPGEQKTRDIIANRVEVLRNLPARVRVATVPPGARVTLSGPTGVAAQGSANGDALVVRRGVYTMTIEAPGYETVRQRVVAEIGQPYSYYFQLQPLRGRVRITASPITARIFVDKRLVGIGSYADSLPIGTYEVTVEAPRRTPVTRTLTVRADRAATLAVHLPEPPRSGRTELLIAAGVGGLFGGGALAATFDPDTTAASLGGLFGVGIGFTGAYFGIDEDIAVGDSSYLIGATAIGVGEGALIASLAACRYDDDDDAVDCGRGQTISGVALASGVAGLGVAAFTKDRLRLSAGDAAMINSGAMWGATTGALFWALFDQPARRPRLGAALTLAGLNVGIAAGATIAARTDYRRGTVALIDLSALAGIVAGVALAQAFPEDVAGTERVQHFALGGMTVGLIAGAYLTRNRDRPRLPRAQPALGAAVDVAGARVATLGARLSF
ncbi:MAG: PEGA domain-containing protein [Deltaproteobacteria bacterium]|nr:MAG: PEGA domain-containing protein [Deltaproteobacteria bacterium]